VKSEDEYCGCALSSQGVGAWSDCQLPKLDVAGSIPVSRSCSFDGLPALRCFPTSKGPC